MLGYEVKLNDENIKEILSGDSVGINAGKVLILKRGLGTPQIGIGLGITDPVEDIIKRRKESYSIED